MNLDARVYRDLVNPGLIMAAAAHHACIQYTHMSGAPVYTHIYNLALSFATSRLSAQPSA